MQVLKKKIKITADGPKIRYFVQITTISISKYLSKGSSSKYIESNLEMLEMSYGLLFQSSQKVFFQNKFKCVGKKQKIDHSKSILRRGECC